jgi:anti-sigma factor RsiW
VRDCARLAPLLGARPGELDSAQARAVESHLATCERCRLASADLAVTDGLVRDGLIQKANARDFAPFVDQVMARVAKAGPAPTQPVPERAPRGLRAWVAGHRRAVGAALAPLMAAAALIVYVRLQGERPGEVAMLELASEGDVTMVLQTSEGPVVLLGEGRS